ncbi:MAG: 3D domain-containing protein [Agathobacter sp.]
MQKKRIMRMINKNFNKIAIALLLTVIAIITCTIIVFATNTESNATNDMAKSTPTESLSDTTSETAESSETPTISIESEDEPMLETPITEPQETFVSLGEYKLTAYCPCTKCCGKWGENRPTDANGNLIVVTASGRYAKANWTVAADTSVLPFGTRIYINGYEYEVQDRGGAVKGNRIDIYFDDHQEALNFGVQYAEVMIKVVEGE